MATKKVTNKIKTGGKVKITPGSAKKDWSDFPQPPDFKSLHTAIDDQKAQELDKKFKTNKFVKKYKTELADNSTEELDKQLEEYYENEINPAENAEDVKKWAEPNEITRQLLEAMMKKWNYFKPTHHARKDIRRRV